MVGPDHLRREAYKAKRVWGETEEEEEGAGGGGGGEEEEEE